jgi:predicted ATPase with chaperone activity
MQSKTKQPEPPLPGSLRDHVLIVGSPGDGKVEWARMQRDAIPYADWGTREGDAEYLWRVAGLDDASLKSEWVAMKADATHPRWAGSWRQPPFRAPHHTVSEAGLVGRVAKGWQLRPGELSLAHGGVFLMDEAHEFRLSCVQVILQAVRDGYVLARFEGNQHVRIPAEFRLVVTSTPCPCGFHGRAATERQPACRCTEPMIERHAARLVGFQSVCRVVPAVEWKAQVVAERKRREAAHV